MQRVFEIFEEILSIPRSSSKEEKIASYIVEFAKTHSLEYKKDEYNRFLKKSISSEDLETLKELYPQLIVKGK